MAKTLRTELVSPDYWEVYLNDREIGTILGGVGGDLPFKAITALNGDKNPDYAPGAPCLTLKEAAEVLAKHYGGQHVVTTWEG